MEQRDGTQGVLRAGAVGALLTVVALALVFAGLISLGAAAEVDPGTAPTLREATRLALELIEANRDRFFVAALGLTLFPMFFIPVVPALYLSLRGARRAAATLAAVTGVAFIVLFLVHAGVEWLFLLASEAYVSAPPAEREAALGAGMAIALLSDPFRMLASLNMGILLLSAGWAMLRAPFSSWVAYLGIASGIIRLYALPIPGSTQLPLAMPMNLLAVVTFALWLVGVALGLLRLAREGAT